MRENINSELANQFSGEFQESKIKNRLLNINAYRGLMQYTQIANIESVINDGLSHGAAKRWGAKGRLVKYKTGAAGIYLTYKDAESNFEDWESLPWHTTGPVAILFKKDLIRKLDLVYIQEDPDGAYEEEITQRDIDLMETMESGDRSTLRTNPDAIISPNEILAFVLSPLPSTIDRRANIFGNHEDKLDITPLQAEELIINRLNRAVEQNPKGEVIPLYDNHGNMLWPKNIPHEQIKQTLESNNDT